MGLFGGNKHSNQQSTSAPAVAAKKSAQSIFDDAYKKELKKLGRQYFAEIIEDDKEELRQELARTFTEAGNDIRGYIRRQFSSSVDYIRQELTQTLNEQLVEHHKMLNEAGENARQSLVTQEQELRTRYDELRRSIEVAMLDQQEKMQIVYTEHERQLAEIQQTQKTQISRFEKTVTVAEQQTDTYTRRLTEIAEQHDAKFANLLTRQQQQLEEVGSVQTAAIQTIKQSAEAIEKQYAAFSESLDGAVDKQRERMLDAFSQNFAVVVEQYLLGALGDQFSVADQLPAILKRLEADKTAIMEDAKL